MNSEQINEFEKTEGQLQALYDEVGQLSKKNPDNAINDFKLKHANTILNKANEILGADYKPLSAFELFDFESMPTTSDVVMILAQYINCMEKFRADNIKQTAFNRWEWTGSDIRTAPPKKIQER